MQVDDDNHHLDGDEKQFLNRERSPVFFQICGETVLVPLNIVDILPANIVVVVEEVEFGVGGFLDNVPNNVQLPLESFLVIL